MPFTVTAPRRPSAASQATCTRPRPRPGPARSAGPAPATLKQRSTAWLRSGPANAERTRASVARFDAPYPPGPCAAALDVITSRRTPADAQASTNAAPAALQSRIRAAGSSTPDASAAWTAAPAPWRAASAATAAPSPAQAISRTAPAGTASRRPRERSSSTTGRSPASSSACATWLPT